MVPQFLQRSGKAGLQGVEITGRFLHEGLGFIRVIRQFAVAIHIQGEGRVAGCRQLLRLFTHKPIMAPPFMHHQYSRAFAFVGIIPGHIAGERFTIYRVFNGFRLQGGSGGADAQGKRKHGRRGAQFRSHGSVLLTWVTRFSSDASRR